MTDPTFYMRVPKPDGTFTEGKIDYNHLPSRLGLDSLDLTGSAVLDVAANDGYWSFWAEQAGASSVTAIDVDSFDGYDWSYDGPPAKFRDPGHAKDGPSQWAEAGAAFWHLHKLWESKVERLNLSVYDLDPATHGPFDLVFNFGLLYHLRHPLLSLDRIRAVCQGVLVLETHVVNFQPDLPAAIFYEGNELNTDTNWCGPNEACVVKWLNSAGFPRVFAAPRNSAAPYARSILVACVDDIWAEKFTDVANLTEYGDDRLTDIWQATRNQLGVAF